MTEIITFGNFKGGVGKTTNATQAAYELSKRGKKTLLLDLDPQANATNIMLKTKVNLTDEIFQFDSSLMSAIQSKDLTKALVNITENLDLIGSSADFSLFPRVMERQFPKYIDRVTYLNELLKPIAQKYDYVIIDVPPTISLITDAALYASDWCVIVMQTQQQALDGASAFIQYMQKEVIDTYHAPRLDLVGILPVLIQPGAPVDNLTLQNAVEEFGQANILPTSIHQMQRLKRYGVTGITNDSRYDKKVFEVYKQVVNNILSRIEANE
ncbi:ATPase [Lactobacillus taiwanensis]|uniref:ParA family protein n=1 Tax=Lactobacillus taiwanensis TaxID=508451 RepID=UPI000B998504|nr:AAA family ATPase [Lactobacillus taiwanensis]OYS00610.1 ATPase [Lactobacillus taiwanensis]OYS04658.1 ATPase [Lactobacillus taiwanensis]